MLEGTGAELSPMHPERQEAYRFAREQEYKRGRRVMFRAKSGRLVTIASQCQRLRAWARKRWP